MKTLFLITARGGSKGIPGKNMKPLAGKPLILYTVEAAQAVAKDKDICVSTDSPEIRDVVEKHGLKVPFLRPAELATDEASSEGVILHALSFYKGMGEVYDRVVLLQPTSPLREAKDIEGAIEQFTPDLDMVVSVFETKANPYYVLFEEGENGFLYKSKEGSFSRRQDCPIVYELNGAVYVINCYSLHEKGMKNFKALRKYEMDRISSIDIDDETDWFMAEQIIKGKQSIL